MQCDSAQWTCMTESEPAVCLLLNISKSTNSVRHSNPRSIHHSCIYWKGVATCQRSIFQVSHGTQCVCKVHLRECVHIRPSVCCVLPLLSPCRFAFFWISISLLFLSWKPNGFAWIQMHFCLFFSSLILSLAHAQTDAGVRTNLPDILLMRFSIASQSIV